MYNLGQLVRITTTVKDANGALVTNATVSAAVTKPDATTAVPSVTSNGDGTYYADILGDQSGFWLYTFTATGTASGVDAGQFVVRIPGARIVSLGEAKRHLDKLGGRTADDEEITDMIDMATVLLEPIVGVMVPRNIVELHDGVHYDRPIYLRRGPVLSIVSIVEHYSDGTSYTLTTNDYLADVRIKRIQRVSAGFVPFPWPVGLINITTTHQAGRNPIPQNIRTGAVELVGNLWRTTQQRSAGQRPGVPSGAVDVIPSTYAIPRRVQEMLFGSRRAPMIGG